MCSTPLAKAIDGGDLALAGPGGIDDPIVVRPTPNTLVSFSGDRVHWVLPLLAGERVSIVINFYAAGPRVRGELLHHYPGGASSSSGHTEATDITVW